MRNHGVLPNRKSEGSAGGPCTGGSRKEFNAYVCPVCQESAVRLRDGSLRPAPRHTVGPAKWEDHAGMTTGRSALLPPHTHVTPGTVGAFWDKFASMTADELFDELEKFGVSAAYRQAHKGSEVLHLLGDTGAFDHMMDKSEAHRLGLPINRLPKEERVVVSTANGPVACNEQTWLELTPGAYTPFTLLPHGQNMFSIGRYVVDMKYQFLWNGQHEVMKWYPLLIAPPDSGWPDIVFHVLNYVPRLTIMPEASYAAPGLVDGVLLDYMNGTFGLATEFANWDSPALPPDDDVRSVDLEECLWQLDCIDEKESYDDLEPFTPWTGDDIDIVQLSEETVVQYDSHGDGVLRDTSHRPADDGGLRAASFALGEDIDLRVMSAALTQPLRDLTNQQEHQIDDMTRPFETFTCDQCGLLGLQDKVLTYVRNGKTLELCPGCREEQQTNAELLGLHEPNPAAAAPRDLRRNMTLKTNLEGFVEEVWSKPLEFLAETFSQKHRDGPTYTLPPEMSNQGHMMDALDINLHKRDGRLGIEIDTNLCVTKGRGNVRTGDVLVKVDGGVVTTRDNVTSRVLASPDQVSLHIYRPSVQQGRECVHAEDRARLHRELGCPRDCNVIFYTHDGKAHKHLRKKLTTLRTNVANMPPWSQVCRRLVMDAKTGDVIEDIDIVHDHELHLFKAKGDSKSDRLNREARMKRKRHQRVPKWHASRFGEVISADSVGRIDESWQNNSYFSTGLDSHTGWIFADPLKSTTADETMKIWSTRLSRCGPREAMYRIHSDGGPEFQAEFHQWCIDLGINHTKSIPHTPQGNSRLERLHGTINAAIRAALNVSGIPLAFWCLAMMHVVHSLNRQPRYGAAGRVPTPYEKRYARPYTGVSLVPFGCQATVVITARENQHKYGPTGEEVLIVGYTRGGKGYKVLPVKLLQEGKPTVYDVEIPESAIKTDYFPARRLKLPSEATYDPDGMTRGKCINCNKWQVHEPVTCPPCRVRKAHRRHTTDWRCLKQRCQCEDWLLASEAPESDGYVGDDGDEAQALADDLIDEYAADDIESGGDPDPEDFVQDRAYQHAGPEEFHYAGSELDASLELPGEPWSPAALYNMEHDAMFEDGEQLQRQYDPLDYPTHEQATDFWADMSGGPTQASHRDGAPDGPTSRDYRGAAGADLDDVALGAVQRRRKQRVRDELDLVRVSRVRKHAKVPKSHQKAESDFVVRYVKTHVHPAIVGHDGALRGTSLGADGALRGTSEPGHGEQGEVPNYALHASEVSMASRRPPQDDSTCSTCEQFRTEHGDAGCVNWYTHTQSASNGPLPEPVPFTGHAQPSLQPDCSIRPAAVAQLYRLQKAFDEDRDKVQAALNKEQSKLIDKVPIGKAVFSEDDVVDREVLRRRARAVGTKTRPSPLIRFSKILLKIYKKGTELPLHLQKWSARACVDGSWITDALNDSKKASDQSPEENLESTPISVECLRQLIALSGSLGNTMFVGDVTGAYLETKLGAGAPEIWCAVPDILRRNKKAYEGMANPMVRLLKALYGLPRAGHDWDAAMRERLVNKGWSALDNQNSIYAKVVDGKLCLLGVYVDDMIVSCPDESVDKVRAELSALFPVEWAGFTPATRVGGVVKQNIDLRFLGVRVLIVREGTVCKVTFSQTEYAQSIVDMYLLKSGKKHCRSVASPSVKVDENAALPKESVGKYKPWSREILGKLLFLERCSRIDIIQAVTHLCGRVCDWSENDDKLLDRLMDYCSGTTKMTLEWVLDSKDQDKIQAVLLTDADWATDRRNSKSVSSWNLTLTGPNTKATVIWGNRKQTFIARSTAEAETGAFVAGLVAALLPALLFIESIAAYARVSGLKGKFGSTFAWRPVAKCDNNAACTALNSRLAGRLSLLSKSSRINLHWARDQLQRSNILVERVPTEINSADLGSKALEQRFHWRLAYTLMTTCKIVYSDVAWDQSASTPAWCPTGTVLGSPWINLEATDLIDSVLVSGRPRPGRPTHK